MTEKEYKKLENKAIKLAKELNLVLNEIHEVDEDWCDCVIERVRDEANI